jgi:hypothetical protein
MRPLLRKSLICLASLGSLARLLTFGCGEGGSKVVHFEKTLTDEVHLRYQCNGTGRSLNLSHKLVQDIKPEWPYKCYNMSRGCSANEAGVGACMQHAYSRARCSSMLQGGRAAHHTAKCDNSSYTKSNMCILIYSLPAYCYEAARERFCTCCSSSAMLA